MHPHARKQAPSPRRDNGSGLATPQWTAPDTSRLTACARARRAGRGRHRTACLTSAERSQRRRQPARAPQARHQRRQRVAQRLLLLRRGPPGRNPCRGGARLRRGVLRCCEPYGPRGSPRRPRGRRCRRPRGRARSRLKLWSRPRRGLDSDHAWVARGASAVRSCVRLAARRRCRGRVSRLRTIRAGAEFGRSGALRSACRTVHRRAAVLAQPLRHRLAAGGAQVRARHGAHPGGPPPSPQMQVDKSATPSRCTP